MRFPWTSCLALLLLVCATASATEDSESLQSLSGGELIGLLDSRDWAPIEVLVRLPVDHGGQEALVVLWSQSPATRWESMRREGGTLDRYRRHIEAGQGGCEARNGPEAEFPNLRDWDECLDEVYPAKIGRCFEEGDRCRDLRLTVIRPGDVGQAAVTRSITLRDNVVAPALDRVTLSDLDGDGAPEIELVYHWDGPPHRSPSITHSQTHEVLDTRELVSQLSLLVSIHSDHPTAAHTRAGVTFEDGDGDGHPDARIRTNIYSPVCVLDADGWPVADAEPGSSVCEVFVEEEVLRYGIEGDWWGRRPVPEPIAPNK